jgi:hypothetical protein
LRGAAAANDEGSAVRSSRRARLAARLACGGPPGCGGGAGCDGVVRNCIRDRYPTHPRAARAAEQLVVGRSAQMYIWWMPWC